MDLHKTILLYSKYSKTSTKLLELVDNCGFNIQEIIGYRLISVDSKTVRKQIMNNRDITVKHVPCLIKLFNNGMIEQYDYKELHQLIEYTIKLHKEEQTKQQTQPTTAKKKHLGVKEHYSNSKSEYNVEEIQTKQRTKRKKQNTQHTKKQRKTTTIDSEDGSETESEDTTILEPEPEPVQSNEKPSAKKQKSDDIMSRAMEMQKERELTEESSDKKPLPRIGPI